jgi:hypothetical protein
LMGESEVHVQAAIHTGLGLRIEVGVQAQIYCPRPVNTLEMAQANRY